MQIITGANGSGKSTYIKQTALIVIMAQMGCYVPASAATVPLRTRLLSRMSTSDDMENNMSTFLVEMREAAHILHEAGPQVTSILGLSGIVEDIGTCIALPSLS